MGTFNQLLNFFNDFPFRGKIVLPLNTRLQRKDYFWKNFGFMRVAGSGELHEWGSFSLSGLSGWEQDVSCMKEIFPSAHLQLKMIWNREKHG